MLNVNRVAFATVCGFAALTGVARFTAVTTTSTVVAVASKIFVVLSATGCCAAMNRWVATRPNAPVSRYFVELKNDLVHIGEFCMGLSFLILDNAWTCAGRLKNEVIAIFSRPPRRPPGGRTATTSPSTDRSSGVRRR